MRRIFLLFGAALLAACVSDGVPVESSFVSAECGSVGGYTRTKITYGDDGIKVRDLTRVRVNTEFRILLKPKPKKDWKDNEVAVKGDTAKSDLDASWIDGSAKEEDLSNGWFVAGCVPDVPSGTEYKFDVDVDGLPVLDPRVHVE